MTQQLDAARALLDRASASHWNSGRVLVLAAAAAVLEQAVPEAGFGAGLALGRADIALPVAAAAEAARPMGRTQRLMHLTYAVPGPERPRALLAAEPFLARIDPQWSMNLVASAVGPDAALDGALGLSIAAQRVGRSLPLPQWVAQAPPGSMLARQFAADASLAAVVRGQVLEEIEPGLGTLLRYSDTLLDTEAAAVLAAVGLLEPARGLTMAERLLQSHAPQALQESLEIVAAAAVQGGLAEQVRELARRPGFVAEQAAWVLAAARSGAMPADEVVALAGSLSPRVADELDPGRTWLAAVPLLAALCHVGRAEHVPAAAVAWAVRVHALADECFAAGDGPAAQNLAEVALPDSLFVGEDAPDENAPGWWLDAKGNPMVRRRATLDVLSLSQSLPWRRTPGSLADLACLGEA